MKPVDVLRRDCPAGIDRLSGKDYINHVGLVYLASKGPPWSCVSEIVETHSGPDGVPISVITTTTITTHEDTPRVYTAIGDATAGNTGIARTALPRMSETRSMNRALRRMLNAPDCTAEEIPTLSDRPDADWSKIDREYEIRALRLATSQALSSKRWTTDQLKRAIRAYAEATEIDDLSTVEVIELRYLIATFTGEQATPKTQDPT